MLDYEYDDQDNITAIFYEDVLFHKVGKNSWHVNRYDVWDLRIQDLPAGHSFDLIDGDVDEETTFRNEILEVVVKRSDDATAQVSISQTLFEDDFNELLNFPAYVRLRRSLIESVFAPHLPLTLERVLGGDIRFHGAVSPQLYCHELIDLVEDLEYEVDKQTKLRIIESLL